jgi:6-phosphogluconolactonase (cycloisomerase 2 family)
LVLQNNGGDLPVSANGSFTFNAAYSGGAAYNVTVYSQPSNPSQNCTVASGTGQISGANVTSIQITCSTNTFTIGGTVSGLSGTGLVLQDNGGNNLPINPGATIFTFATPIASGGSYDVTVLSQPSSPNPCVVADGSGPITNGNITSVQVTCGTLAYASNQNDDTISAYLVSVDGTLTALPSSPFLAGSNPAGLAVDSSQTFLYVANVHSGDVSGYAIAPDGSLSPIPGSPFPAASGAISVAIDPTGSFLYVPSCGAACAGTGNGAIAAFSITPGTGALVPVPGSPFAAGTSPYEMAFVTPGVTGTFAYVANRGSNNISGFSIQPNGALSAVSGSPFGAGTSPLALAVDQAFDQLFAVNASSGTVSAYSVHVDGSLLLFSTISTGASTTSAAVDANQDLYVTGGSGVLGFAANALPVTPIAGSPFAAGPGPNAVRIPSGGEFLYAVNEGGNSVSGYSINASTGQLTPTPSSPFATGASPYSIAFPAHHSGVVGT